MNSKSAMLVLKQLMKHLQNWRTSKGWTVFVRRDLLKPTYPVFSYLGLTSTVALSFLLTIRVEQAVSAFSFTIPPLDTLPCSLALDPTLTHCSQTSVNIADGVLTTSLLPINALPLGGTQNLLNGLTNSVWAQNGWQFNSSNTNISGRFDIGVYNALAYPNSVGADFQLRYAPSGDDPLNNVHWIQVVTTNHLIDVNLAGQIILNQYLGNSPVSKIDVFVEQRNLNHIDLNPQRQSFNPFYDTYGDAAQNYFNDFVGRRTYLTEPRIWLAELYLVRLVAPRTVAIYNGVSWGWRSDFAPASAQGCTGGSGGGGCEQSDPVEGVTIDGNYGSLLFGNVSSGSWYGAGALLPPNLLVPDRYGIQFQALEGSLFNSIDALPLGIDTDDLFTIAVDGTVLGEFAAADSIDFVSLLGSGVASFEVAGIEPILGTTADPLFPIQLSFAGDTGSFSTSLLDCTINSGYSGGGGFSSGYSGGGGVGCEPYSVASGVGLLSDSSFARTRPVPEPSSIFGVIVFSILSGLGIISFRQRQP